MIGELFFALLHLLAACTIPWIALAAVMISCYGVLLLIRFVSYWIKGGR